MSNELPEMLDVNGSDNIAKVGHDDRGLFVLFNKGACYLYAGAPSSSRDDCRLALSPGVWLNENIKGRYPHSRVY